MKICIERMKIFNTLLDICGGKCLKGEDCHVCGEAPPGPAPAAAPLNRPPDDVRVVDSPFDVEAGGEYRLRNDDANIVRIRFKLPVTGKAIRLFAGDVPAAGVSFGEALANTAAFISGKDRSLVLERDPNNRHDPNAIRVIGRWRGVAGREHEGQIGWVPKRIAARIATQAKGIPLHGALQTLFRPQKGKNPGIRFGIWV